MRLKSGVLQKKQNRKINLERLKWLMKVLTVDVRPKDCEIITRIRQQNEINRFNKGNRQTNQVE